MLTWAVDVTLPGREPVSVHAQTLSDGQLLDLQSEVHAGTTGDADVDEIIAEKIAAAIRLHNVLRDLDAARPRLEPRALVPRHWAA
jgi:hypothetical protein